MKLWPITVLLSNLAQGQNYNGLNCSPDNWQTHMPNFVKEFNKQKRLRAKLKLYGGSTASEKKFNWVVQISEIGYRQGHCTGAIINADWILTAAHCFWKEDMPNVIDYEHVTTTYDVKLGHDTRLQRQSFKISEIFHPEEAYSDIVLIRLEKSIDFATTKAGVVCLPSENWNKYEEQNYYDTKCYAAGFGYRNNREKSNNLQEATFPVTSCRIYQSFIRDEFGTEKILCSRQNHKGSHALCQGDSGGPLFCLHQDQPMLVGVARTSTGCESQPNYGHATFTNVAWWNKWMRQVIEKRDSTIHCLEPFEIIKVDKNSTNFARIVKVSDQYLHLRLNQTNSFNENDPETKKIFQCKTQCERTAGCVKFILVGGLDCLIIYGRGQVHQTPKTITLHSLLGTSVESFWVGTLDDEHGDYGRCGLRKTPPKPFIFVSKKVLIQSTPLQSTNAAAVTNTWTKYKRQFNQKFASSFRYRLTGGPLNSFEVELYLAMRTLSTAYPLATDGDGLIRGLIREIFGKENVIQSDNEVAYAKLFNVQRTAEFCDLSTMNGQKCSCVNGFVERNGACHDEDECANHSSCPETKHCVNSPGSYTCQDKIEIDPYMTLASSRSSQTTSSRTALRTIAANDKKKVRLDKLIERLVINPESRCATKNIELSEIVRTDSAKTPAQLLTCLLKRVDVVYKFCNRRKLDRITDRFRNLWPLINGDE